MHRARVYADVNEKRSMEYCDYSSLVIQWGDPNDYKKLGRRGQGGSSEVFEGRIKKSNERCIIKVLKRTTELQMKSEVKILQNLDGGPNIVKLLDVVRDPNSRTHSLIFEYVNNTWSFDLYPTLTDNDIRYYMYELLKALDYCHSRGIMHCDVKPENVMIDHEQRKLRLIDWGLADFYHPGKENVIPVITRNYRGPEIFLGFKYYDYSLDMWSLGCLFAAMIFGKEPFFWGSDDNFILLNIAWVLGTDELNTYLNKYHLELPPLVRKELGSQKTPWEKFIKPSNQHLVSPEAQDLVDKLLCYDHQDRLTAQEAMAHPYFSPVRDAAYLG